VKGNFSRGSTEPQQEGVGQTLVLWSVSERQWAKPQGPEVQRAEVHLLSMAWVTPTLPIKKIDQENATITLAQASWHRHLGTGILAQDLVDHDLRSHSH